MTVLLAWLAFPVLLAALCLGCGLLLEACMGRRLPGALLAPLGFAVVVVLAGILTARGETASLATPAVALAALLGAVLGRPWGWAVDRWALAAALAVFAVFAAPVVLSGEPTFAGYIKLDDTATWMAFVDQAMDHGRNLSRLEPSSYQRTLEVNLPAGYPIGAFLPLGVGSKLTGTDVAWLVQPYMATMAALLALALSWLARPLFRCRRLPALVAFGAAQAALLYAYSLWGGIKEVAAALAIAALATALPALAREGAGWRDGLPAAVGATALLIMVGSGGLVWVAPLLGLLALAIWRRQGLLRALDLLVPLLVVAAVLAVPALFAADVFSPTQGGLTDEAELGNLIAPLSVFQVVGIWPAGDFRFDPGNEALTAYLIVLALAAVVAALVLAWRRRSWPPLLFAVATAAGSLAVFAYSSPWVGAKALASAAPAVLLLALAGAAAYMVRVERTLGATVLALLLAGVLWSNALGYHDVSLAPYDQLRELEEIGEDHAGEGPALMTEFQPYGVRHFLRDLDAEGASELRARPVPLVGGGQLAKGEWADTDQVVLSSLLIYRTLVLRHNPLQSRPPSVYSLVERGDFYDVWQRAPEAGGEIVEHLPLGSAADPGAVPACAEVRRLAALAGADGALVAPPRAANRSVSLSEAERPDDWPETDRGQLIPAAAGSARVRLALQRPGRYDLYLEGSARNRLSLSVDGMETGSARMQINEPRQFLDLGRTALEAGPHLARLTQAGQSPAPGSGGPAYPIGPLVLSPVGAEDPPLLRVPSGRAEELCGKRLDWVEALR